MSHQDRLVLWRQKIIAHAAHTNVSAACRYYGVSRQFFYRWQRRYAADGVAGLRDHSRRPHRHPKATRQEVVGKILYLRTTYHFGPARIMMYLDRYHGVTTTTATIYHILKRHGLNRLPHDQRRRTAKMTTHRYEKAVPGERLQVDVKFLEPLSGQKTKRYQYTAIDDCTRLRILRIYEKNNQDTAIAFIDHVLERLPFRVHTVQTDDGSEFQARFHWHLQDRGIRHVYIKPRTPRLNGKVERSHRIDGDEFYQFLDPNLDLDGLHEKIAAWERYYNYERPSAALDGKTPYERLQEKLKDPKICHS